MDRPNIVDLDVGSLEVITDAMSDLALDWKENDERSREKVEWDEM